MQSQKFRVTVCAQILRITPSWNRLKVKQTFFYFEISCTSTTRKAFKIPVLGNGYRYKRCFPFKPDGRTKLGDKRIYIMF